MNRLMAMMPVLALAALLAGCVEKTIKITSQPSGAMVLLNNEEVGRTPAEVHFTFYGDYGVTLRKEGFETLQTHRQINAPWYQWPPFDIVADLLVPTTIHDRHAWDFQMQPQVLPARAELLQRAEEFRADALRLPATQPAATEPADSDGQQSAVSGQQ